MTADLHPGRWWTTSKDGRHVCELCPRRCHLKPDQRGFCFVRMGTEDGIALTTWGRSSGFCVDPIEKKPLHQFLPGTPVLSFGTAGCNLGCKFCQNWDISKARDSDRLQDRALPEQIAAAAVATGSRSVAFTYNDPVIFAEYAFDTAAACHERGVRTVAVTAGYIGECAREEFFGGMDAANVDLKGFTERFYQEMCFGELEPVKDTLRWLGRASKTHLEITTLLIPGENDSDDELHALCAFVREEVGPQIPLHFTAYHPDFKFQHAATPVDTVRRARQIGLDEGLANVYTGNVHDPDGQVTRCPSCAAVVIARDGYRITRYAIVDGRCACGAPIYGVFENAPGAWGSRRQPVRIGASAILPR